jgi:hypothetical protein
MTTYFIVRCFAATDTLLIERLHKSTRQEAKKRCSMCERNVTYKLGVCDLKRYISLSCFLADFPCATWNEGMMTGACDHLPPPRNVCANCSITKPSVKVMGIERPCDANLQFSENRRDVLKWSQSLNIQVCVWGLCLTEW